MLFENVLTPPTLLEMGIYHQLTRPSSLDPLPRIAQERNDSCSDCCIRYDSMPEEFATTPHPSFNKASFTVKSERNSVWPKGGATDDRTEKNERR